MLHGLRQYIWLLLTWTVLCLCHTGCQRNSLVAMPTNRRATSGVFRDVTERAGITFRHSNGAMGKFLFIETTPSGCAFFDSDHDGWLDVLLLNGKPLISSSTPRLGEGQGRGSSITFYRNNRNGTFTDVTRGSGLDSDLNYAHGVAVGDYDNDGREDVVVTAYGGNRLFHNLGGGRFEDVTDKAGVADHHDGAHWATSVAFGDYDNDGFLDLYVCHYCEWSPAKDAQCLDRYGERIYCDPTIYRGDVGRLYRNNRNGTFTDVSVASGVAKFRARGLGVVWLDYDGDGWQDIYVANDMDANFLYHNEGDGTFREQALVAGVAYGASGKPLSGMGIAVGDYDNNGYEDLYVTNFSGQTNSLYRNDGGGMFTYTTENAGLAGPTWHHLGFGVAFLDYNRDGILDLVVGNGHVNTKIEQASVGVTYAQPKGLYRNRGDGTFESASADRGDMAHLRVTRGLAIGDYDNDGRIDVLACNQNDRAELFRNVSRDDHRWISLRLVGTRSNRSGYGTKVYVRARNQKHFAECRSGASYLSASDARVYVGLGKTARVDVALHWLSGQREMMKELETNRFYVCTEGQGCKVDERTK